MQMNKVKCKLCPASIKLQNMRCHVGKHILKGEAVESSPVDSDEQAVLFKSIQENSYRANPENILLAMVVKFNFIGRG